MKYILILIFGALSIICTAQTIYVTSKLDVRYINYQDSLKLYNEYKILKNKLIEAGYKPESRSNWNTSGELSMKEVANWIDYKIRPNSDRERYKVSTFNRILGERVGNLYRVIDFLQMNINYELGFQYFSLKIKYKSVQQYGSEEHDGDGRLLYEYIKPSIKVVYKPENIIPDTTKTARIEYKTLIGDKLTTDSSKTLIVDKDFSFKN